MNLKNKFILCLGVTLCCLLPVSVKADGNSAADTVIKFLPKLQQSLMAEDNSGKFTEAVQPSSMEVTPITDVNEYLPDEVYPTSVGNEEFLKLIAPRKDVYTIIDLETGKHFNAKRYGGNKHLDTEPATAADAEILASICSESWDRRAILVYFNNSFYAASMNTMPHGNGFVSENGYDGHFCVHVIESQTHGGGKVCPLHQDKINQALNTNIAEISGEIFAISNNSDNEIINP